MEELSDEDRLPASAPARKIQRFLSQPFDVAETFTGKAGQCVKVEDTVRAFKVRSVKVCMTASRSRPST